jgi:hypothetical protein
LHTVEVAVTRAMQRVGPVGARLQMGQRLLHGVSVPRRDPASAKTALARALPAAVLRQRLAARLRPYYTISCKERRSLQ